MAKLFTLIVALVAVCLVVAPLGADDFKLEGQYTVVSAEKNGQAVAQDELTGKTVRITADKITVMTKDHTCTYTLDSTKKPHVIKTKGTGSQQGKDHVGLIEKTADNQIRIILAEGTEVPTEFKTKEGQQMWVLKPSA